MLKNKIFNTDYYDSWEGVPEPLKEMCIGEVTGSDRNDCAQSAIEYLEEHLEADDLYATDSSPYDTIYTINEAFESCLFPLEFHEDLWREHSGGIGRILNRSKQLIEQIAPSDYKTGYRTPYDYHLHRINIIGLYQNLNVYFAVLYMFSEEWEKLRKTLDTILADTERNVQQKVSRNLAKDLCKLARDYKTGAIFFTPPVDWVYERSDNEITKQGALLIPDDASFEESERIRKSDRFYLNIVKAIKGQD